MTRSPRSLSAADIAWEMVEQIIQAACPVALAATGGGSLAMHWLLDHPGASRVITDAHIPYHEAALADYLQAVGPHPAIAETARQLAWVAALGAHRHAGQGMAVGKQAVGVGVTAALATRRRRKGEDRAHLAVRCATSYRLCHLHFDKHNADRHRQEEVLSLALLGLLADIVGGGVSRPPMPAWVDRVDTQLTVVEALEELLSSRRAVASLPMSAAASASSSSPPLLVPGSFNPLHDGHRGLARAAARLSGRLPILEISAVNVDKPPLGYAEIHRRWTGLRQEFDLLVTREPTFAGKAAHFPGCDFAIGYDTAVRVVDPAYYGSTAQMEQALKQLQKGGSRFFVAGRLLRGKYQTLTSLVIPARYRPLFIEIPATDFRLDISSTQLRSQEAGIVRNRITQDRIEAT